MMNWLLPKGERWLPLRHWEVFFAAGRIIIGATYRPEPPYDGRTYFVLQSPSFRLKAA